MTLPFIEFEEIRKAFFGVKVLNGISFTVPQGAVVGLVGENGAGKSTLMNIVGGNMPADAGTMRLAGQEYKPAAPRDAQRRGIAFIHQELNLFPNLSIAENLFITRLDRIPGLPLVNTAALNRKARGLMREVNLERPPDCLVEKLSSGERQLVEIAKALSIDARLVIFDEPTTSLSDREIQRLFELIGQMRARGISIIYISHALDHVLRLCDRIVVLRDGTLVAEGPAAAFSHDKLVSHMVGREMAQVFPNRQPVSTGDIALRVKNLSRAPKLKDVSFTLHRGEILGFAGLMGAGRSELARCLFGVDPISGGEIEVLGRRFQKIRPRSAIRSGLAFLPEDRGVEGLYLDFSVLENLASASLPRRAGRPFGRLNWASIREAVRSMRERVRIDTKVLDSQPVRTLSGGNQQKVVLGKWLLNDPHIVILDEPTRGIDVGAKFEIYDLIDKLAQKGAAILVISSEIEELIGLCNRILTLCRGQITAEFRRNDFDREAILRLALRSP